MEIKANKNLYVYHTLTDGCNAIEYCSLYYDKLHDFIFVVPDSAFNDFINHTFDNNIHVKVEQLPYSF